MVILHGQSQWHTLKPVGDRIFNRPRSADLFSNLDFEQLASVLFAGPCSAGREDSAEFPIFEGDAVHGGSDLDGSKQLAFRLQHLNLLSISVSDEDATAIRINSQTVGESCSISDCGWKFCENLLRSDLTR